MFFTLGGVSVIIGLRNGFGFDLAGNNGFIVKMSAESSLSYDDIDMMMMGEVVEETAGIMLLLPFVYVTVQWSV
jgi:hypothetical protein